MTVTNFTLTSVLSVLLLVLPLSAKITFIQQNYTTSSVAVSTIQVAYPAGQTAGNLNIVVVGWNDTSAAVSSVSDSRGNSYALAAGPTAGTALTQSIYYAKNIAAGNNTVTIKFNRAAVYPDVRVLEYSGLDTTNPLDVSRAAAGTGLSPNSGAAATTSLSELIFGAGTTFTSFTAAGSGFTNRVITNFGDLAEDATVLSMGTFSATAPLRASAPWVMQMAAFRGLGQASNNPPPTVTSITPNGGTSSGGTAVTITGTGFLAGATVRLGGTAATGVTVVNSTSIRATTPSHAAGAVSVVVTNADNQAGTLANGYTYTTSGSGGSSGGGGTIAFVQVKSATPQSPSASVAVAYSSAQTAGNLNIVAVGWNDSTSTVSSVVDSRGNTYTLAIGPTSGTGLRQSIYYAKNIAAGSNTVTVKFNQAAAYVDVRVLEYSGLDKVSPLDKTEAAAGSGTNASSGAAATTTASELIFGAGMTTTHYSGSGTGFVSRIITNPDADIAEDKTVSSTGSYSATAPLTSSNWVMQMATFRSSGQSSSSGGQSSSQRSVSLIWDPPPPSTMVAHYNVYRGTRSGGPYNLLSSNTTSTSFTDSTVQAGVAYYYVTTTVDNTNSESIFSNEYHVVIPTP